MTGQWKYDGIFVKYKKHKYYKSFLRYVFIMKHKITMHEFVLRVNENN